MAPEPQVADPRATRSYTSPHHDITSADFHISFSQNDLFNFRFEVKFTDFFSNLVDSTRPKPPDNKISKTVILTYKIVVLK